MLLHEHAKIRLMDNLLYILTEENQQLREKVINKRDLKINLGYADSADGAIYVDGSRLIDPEDIVSGWCLAKSDIGFEIKISSTQQTPRNDNIAQLLARFRQVFSTSLPFDHIERVTLYNSAIGGIVELRVCDGVSRFNYDSYVCVSTKSAIRLMNHVLDKYEQIQMSVVKN